MAFFSHKYPQNIWAGEIVSIFRKGIIKHDLNSLVCDAPCGNGIIGNLVSRKLSEYKFTLLDNDPGLKNSPYTQNLTERISLINGDIFAFQPEGNSNTWLLINSLYCLPDAEQLIAGKKAAYRNIIAVFPDTESSNFRYFKIKNPGFQNPSLMDIKSTKELFHKSGFKMVYEKRVTRLPFHKLNKICETLHVPPVLKNIVFSVLDKIMFFLPGQYTIIAFIRYEEHNTLI